MNLNQQNLADFKGLSRWKLLNASRFPPSLLFFKSPFPGSHTPEAEETHSLQA